VDRRKTRLIDKLQRLIGEGAAALFRDGSRLADDAGELETQASLVWHCAREIESAIFQALNPVAPFDEAANSKRKRAAQCEAIIAALELDTSDAAVGWWRKTSLHSFAHRANLGPPREFTPADWELFQDALSVILDRFEARYDRMLRQLDGLLAWSPAQAGKETSRLLCSVPPTGRATALRYFFERADETWLNALPNCILDNPPDPETVADQPGYVRFPTWHAATYLAKVAESRPEAVHRRVMRILALEPTNPRIHIDLIQAARHFPPRLMGEWADAEARWLRKQPFVTLTMPHHIAEAVDLLADAGCVDEAFALAEALLAVAPLSEHRPREPGIRMRPYDYQRACRRIGGRLSDLDARRTTEMLASLLQTAVLQVHPGTAGEFSRIWLRTLTEPPDGRRTTLGQLTAALADAVDVSVQDADGLASSLDWLRSIKSTSLFQRLAIDLLRKKRHLSRAAAERDLADPATYSRETLRETLELLLEEAPQFDDELVAKVRDALARSSLEGETAEAVAGSLETMRSGTVPPEIDDFLGPQVRWSRVEPERSPLTSDQMRRWSLRRLVTSFGKGDHSEDAEGEALLRTFYEVVRAEPRRFASAGRRLARLNFAFASAYLRALREAAADGTELDWNALLALIDASLIVNHTWAGPDAMETRKAAAWLLLSGLESDHLQLSGRAQARMRRVLAVLLADPSPTQDDERRLRDEPDALSSLRLNSIRPIAVYVAAGYLAWLKQQPEAPTNLSRHAEALLGPVLRDDRSPAVFSALGQRVALLYWIDRNWLIATIPYIFPRDGARTELRDAAWSGYLDFRNVYLDLFEHLRPEYERALDALDRSDDEEPTQDQMRLAEHLFLLARGGTIGPESIDGLLRRFFELAPPRLVAGAIHQFGWQLWVSRDQELDADETQRIRVVWGSVRSWAEDGLFQPDALDDFGWLFASGHLDDEWSLDELDTLVAADVAIRELHVVFERLLGMLDSHPFRVARTTEALVAHELNDDELHGDDLRLIALSALESPDARPSGEALVNRMRTRGFTRFPEK
jgi:hypothetical protein